MLASASGSPKTASTTGWASTDTEKTQRRWSNGGTGTWPAFERLLADIEAGRIDVVVAQEWPRLERNRADGVRIIEAAQRHRVLLTVARGSDIDCTTAAGRLAADFFSAMARNEIEVKAERQSRAQLQRARQGRPPKGVRPLGYAINGDVIEHEARAVRQLFTLFAIEDGPSLVSLARGLSGIPGPDVPASLPRLPRHARTLMIERNVRRTEQGLPARDVPDDKPWSSSTVLGILRNPRYAGYSVYTDRTQREAADKRRTWYAQIVRDENGDPVRGQWEPLVDEATWWAVQERLNAPERITNRTGSVARAHLGAGMFLCGVCGLPVRTVGLRYRCPEGHVTRTRSHIDDWVVRIVEACLALPDLAALLPSRDKPRLQAIDQAMGSHLARIKRAQADYDAELIEAFDLKRIRDAEQAAITALQDERRALSVTSDLSGVLDAQDPVSAFQEAPLMIRRRVIDTLCTVRLLLVDTTEPDLPEHPSASGVLLSTVERDGEAHQISWSGSLRLPGTRAMRSPMLLSACLRRDGDLEVRGASSAVGPRGAHEWDLADTAAGQKLLAAVESALLECGWSHGLARRCRPLGGPSRSPADPWTPGAKTNR